MVIATATGANGEQITVLGLTRTNLDRLVDGQPIRVTAETHPGFPEGRVIYICFGETERVIATQLRELIGEKTKVIAVPHEHPTIPS
jgi:hypothetical protein